MLYGKKECVDYLIRDLAAQKLPMRFYKDNGEEMSMFVECQIRILPFGLYEFVFPREHLDIVLNSLWFDKPTMAYHLDKEFSLFRFKIQPLKYLKEFLRIEEPPKEFKKDRKLLLHEADIGIIPIGIRHEEHPDILETSGWKHEAI